MPDLATRRVLHGYAFRPRITSPAVEEAADLIISKFRYSWAYFCQFRFALAVGQRALMAGLPLTAPSLEIGINDGSSATIAHFGKSEFTWGGDMPEESTYESMGLHVEPHFDKYENVIGMDAHEIPFPDNSFNTIVTNDMLPYGLDRRVIVREMVRVLAPGGTIFLTDTSGHAKKYPHLVHEIQKVVPTFDGLDDAVGFYAEQFAALGMVDFAGDTWLDHRLCSMLLASLWRGETEHKIDDAKRGFYEEGLRSLAALMVEGKGDGWQVWATARKPGELQERAKPTPICPRCRGVASITQDDCTCSKCGVLYRSVMGNAYILKDFAKVYSPKINHAVKDHTGALRNALTALVKKLPPSVNLLGFDKSSRYTIRFLADRGIKINAIYSDNPLYLGHEVLGVAIQLPDLSSTTAAIVAPFSEMAVASYRGVVHDLHSAIPSRRDGAEVGS